MAHAALSPIEQLSLDQVTCGVCKNLFKDARVLTCQHSFCTECLIKIHRAARGQSGQVSKSLQCPVDRQKTVLPRNGVMGLRLDFRWQQMAEAMKGSDVAPSTSPSASCPPPPFVKPLPSIPNRAPSFAVTEPSHLLQQCWPHSDRFKWPNKGKCVPLCSNWYKRALAHCKQQSDDAPPGPVQFAPTDNSQFVVCSIDTAKKLQEEFGEDHEQPVPEWRAGEKDAEQVVVLCVAFCKDPESINTSRYKNIVFSGRGVWGGGIGWGRSLPECYVYSGDGELLSKDGFSTWGDLMSSLHLAAYSKIALVPKYSKIALVPK